MRGMYQFQKMAFDLKLPICYQINKIGLSLQWKCYMANWSQKLDAVDKLLYASSWLRWSLVRFSLSSQTPPPLPIRLVWCGPQTNVGNIVLNTKQRFYKKIPHIQFEVSTELNSCHVIQRESLQDKVCEGRPVQSFYTTCYQSEWHDKARLLNL